MITSLHYIIYEVITILMSKFQKKRKKFSKLISHLYGMPNKKSFENLFLESGGFELNVPIFVRTFFIIENWVDLDE